MSCCLLAHRSVSTASLLLDIIWGDNGQIHIDLASQTGGCRFCPMLPPLCQNSDRHLGVHVPCWDFFFFLKKQKSGKAYGFVHDVYILTLFECNMLIFIHHLSWVVMIFSFWTNLIYFRKNAMCIKYTTLHFVIISCKQFSSFVLISFSFFFPPWQLVLRSWAVVRYCLLLWYSTFVLFHCWVLQTFLKLKIL